MKKKEIFEKLIQKDYKNYCTAFFSQIPAIKNKQFYDHYCSFEKQSNLEYINGKVVADFCTTNFGHSRRTIDNEKIVFTAGNNFADEKVIKGLNINKGIFNNIKRLHIIKTAEKILLNKDTTVEGLAFKWVVREKLISILNSNGFAGLKTESLAYISINITILKDNRYYNGHASKSYFMEKGIIDAFEVLKLIELAIMAAENFFNSRPLKPGLYDIVFSNQASGIIFHEIAGHLAEADYIHNDQSVFAAKFGKTVADDQLTLMDSSEKYLPVSYSFDDEGSSAQQATFIENGKFVKILTDTYHAINMNIPLTGNGRKGSFNSGILPRMSNTIVQPGKYTKEDILHSVSTGLLITDAGSGYVNTSNGRFTFEGSSGFYLENGQITYPVHDLKLTGSSLQTLKKVKMIGNDSAKSDIHLSCEKEDQYIAVGFMQPTVKISKIRVS